MGRDKWPNLDGPYGNYGIYLQGHERLEIIVYVYIHASDPPWALYLCGNFQVPMLRVSPSSWGTSGPQGARFKWVQTISLPKYTLVAYSLVQYPAVKGWMLIGSGRNKTNKKLPCVLVAFLKPCRGLPFRWSNDWNVLFFRLWRESSSFQECSKTFIPKYRYVCMEIC